MAAGLYARGFRGQVTDKVITIGTCHILKIGISAFFPRNVANLATFFPKTSFVEVAARFFCLQVAKFCHKELKTLLWLQYVQKQIPVQHGAYFPAFNPVPSPVKAQYTVKPALCNVRRKGNACSFCSSIRNLHSL
jgi:hypothetical protein